jgi:Mn2+/Fe2+ NRAMP family transporter
MVISNDTKIMGDYVNGKLARLLGWGTTALMTAAAIILSALAYGGGRY